MRSTYRRLLLRWFEQVYTFQTLGFGLIAIGVILLMISALAASRNLVMQTVAFLARFLWYDVVHTVAFFSSIALIALGTVLLVAARRVKPEQEQTQLTIRNAISRR